MASMMKVLRRVMHGTLVLGLAGAVAGILLAGPAAAQPYYGDQVHDCHGIWWNTDWNQECPGGADVAGLYESTADCTPPQIPDQYEAFNRPQGSTASYDGDDCSYGIQGIDTDYD